MSIQKLCSIVLVFAFTTIAWSQKSSTPPAALPPVSSSSQPQGDILVGSIQLIDKGKAAIQTYNVEMETSFSFSKKTSLDKFINVLDENNKRLYFKSDDRSLLMVATASTIFVDIPDGGRAKKGTSTGERTLYVGDHYAYRATGKVDGGKLLLTSLEAIGKKPPIKTEKAKK